MGTLLLNTLSQVADTLVHLFVFLSLFLPSALPPREYLHAPTGSTWSNFCAFHHVSNLASRTHAHASPRCQAKMAMAQSTMGLFGDVADQDSGAAAASRTLDTLVGITFAIAGALLGGRITSCLSANFLSCMFIGTAFASRRLLGWEEVGGAQAAEGSTWWWDIVFTKFVGSFCGAMSGFASMLSDYGRLMHNDNRQVDAVLAFSGNVMVAMLWMIVFYAFDRQGLDVYSHALSMKGDGPFQY
jgi:fluoride ion exporter CrcB/FEX